MSKYDLHDGPPSRVRKITREQKTELLDAVTAGHPYADIAARFGIHISAVGYYATRHFTREQRLQFRRAAVERGDRPGSHRHTPGGAA